MIGCIPPLCDLLTVADPKIVQVALNGLENILKAGDQRNIKPNPYAVAIEECYGEFIISRIVFIIFFKKYFLLMWENLEGIVGSKLHGLNSSFSLPFLIFTDYRKTG